MDNNALLIQLLLDKQQQVEALRGQVQQYQNQAVALTEQVQTLQAEATRQAQQGKHERLTSEA